MKSLEGISLIASFIISRGSLCAGHPPPVELSICWMDPDLRIPSAGGGCCGALPGGCAVHIGPSKDKPVAVNARASRSSA